VLHGRDAACGFAAHGNLRRECMCAPGAVLEKSCEAGTSQRPGAPIVMRRMAWPRLWMLKVSGLRSAPRLGSVPWPTSARLPTCALSAVHTHTCSLLVHPIPSKPCSMPILHACKQARSAAEGQARAPPGCSAPWRA
jgi:hypothetical protein